MSTTASKTARGQEADGGPEDADDAGIMGERLAGGNVGLALLANTVATGAALVALILTFSPLSGAHFNPIVTLAARLSQGASDHQHRYCQHSSRFHMDVLSSFKHAQANPLRSAP